MASMTKKMVWADVEEDLCDTCSGDTDDVRSVCSWTTDHGDFKDVEKHAGKAAGDNVNSAAWSAAQDYNMPMPYPQGMMASSMPMCYVAMPMSMCYVVMPGGGMSCSPVENAAPWQDASWVGPDEEWPVPPKKQWGQSHSHAPGTWAKPVATPLKDRAQAKKHRGAPSAAGRKGSSDSSSQGSVTSETTTIILRNLPLKCTRNMLLQLLNDEGFSGGYDFVHLPIDFQTKVGLGYALVNLVSHSVALSAQQHFGGFTRWPVPCDNVCEVAWNSPYQGLDTHIDRYRNSPLMHPRVPETYRPVLFENGVRVPFPAPTTRIRAPRIRHQKPHTAIEA